MARAVERETDLRILSAKPVRGKTFHGDVDGLIAATAIVHCGIPLNHLHFELPGDSSILGRGEGASASRVSFIRCCSEKLV
jgi:hypothetical protein